MYMPDVQQHGSVVLLQSVRSML